MTTGNAHLRYPEQSGTHTESQITPTLLDVEAVYPDPASGVLHAAVAEVADLIPAGVSLPGWDVVRRVGPVVADALTVSRRAGVSAGHAERIIVEAVGQERGAILLASVYAWERPYQAAEVTDTLYGLERAGSAVSGAGTAHAIGALDAADTANVRHGKFPAITDPDWQFTLPAGQLDVADALRYETSRIVTGIGPWDTDPRLTALTVTIDGETSSMLVVPADAANLVPEGWTLAEMPVSDRTGSTYLLLSPN